jgi:integrase
VASYEGVLKHILPELGHIPLAKLTPQHLVRLYRAKQDEGLTRTVVLIHALLHKALGQAERWGLIPRNVAALVDTPRVPKQETLTLDSGQVQKLLAVAENDRLHALYVVATTCGLRQGELLGLRWSDVDLDGRMLTISRQLQWLEGGPTYSEPKSAKSRRTIALPQMALAALRRHRTQQAAERLRAGHAWKDNDLVFTSTVGTPLNPSGVRQRSFQPLLEQAGLPHVKFHSLRHACSSMMANQGVPPKVAADILGHSQVRTVLDVYTHATTNAMREAAAGMDSLLGGSNTRPQGSQA